MLTLSNFIFDSLEPDIKGHSGPSRTYLPAVKILVIMLTYNTVKRSLKSGNIRKHVASDIKLVTEHVFYVFFFHVCIEIKS